MVSVTVAIFIGLAVSLLTWSLGLLDYIAPRRRPPPTKRPAAAAEARVAGAVPIHRPSDTELQAQRTHCAAVKQRSLDAAKSMVENSDGDGDVVALGAALDSLNGIGSENGTGPLGVLSTTELCNALLEADALSSLEALQKHANGSIAQRSTELFQHVIPRIWSF